MPHLSTKSEDQSQIATVFETKNKLAEEVIKFEQKVINSNEIEARILFFDAYKESVKRFEKVEARWKELLTSYQAKYPAGAGSVYAPV